MNHEKCIASLVDTEFLSNHLVGLEAGDEVSPGHGGDCHGPRHEDQEDGGRG